MSNSLENIIRASVAETKTAADAAPLANTRSAEYQAAYRDGFNAAMDRFETVAAADGIKGSNRRVLAACELMRGAPNMSAAEVVSFIAERVPVAANDGGSGKQIILPQAYERQPVAAAGLALPLSASASGGTAFDRAAVESVYSSRRAVAAGGEG